MDREGGTQKTHHFIKGNSKQMDLVASKFTWHRETEAGGKEINKNKTGFPQIIKDLNSRLRIGMEKEWPWKYL